MTEPQHRSLEFLRQTRDFTADVNAMVTRILSAGGNTTGIAQDETSVELEAAALMSAAAALAFSGGDITTARDVIWPKMARGQLSTLDRVVTWAEEREAAIQ